MFLTGAEQRGLVNLETYWVRTTEIIYWNSCIPCRNHEASCGDFPLD